MHSKKIVAKGKDVTIGTKVLIMTHGRGADSIDILALADHLDVNDFALLAPSATNNTWYPYSFMAPAIQNEPWLSSALQVLKGIEQEILEKGIKPENIFFLGFSQGACLTLEYVTRNAKRYGGVIAFTGGLIGDEINSENYRGDFNSTPIFIGTSDPDPHVPIPRVEQSVSLLKTMNAVVDLRIYPGMGHTISADEIAAANQILALPAFDRGFSD